MEGAADQGVTGVAELPGKVPPVAPREGDEGEANGTGDGPPEVARQRLRWFSVRPETPEA